MELLRHILMMLPVCFLLAGPSTVFADDNFDPKPQAAVTEKQQGSILLIVSGRTLTGPNSYARTINGRTMIPMAAVARSLGDTLSLSPENRTVSIVRGTGISATFEARLGQVLENGVAVLTIPISGELIFNLDPEELMLPIEIAAALFDASIRFDTTQGKVLIDRGRVDSSITTRSQNPGAIQVYQAEYEYGFNRYSGSVAQSLVLNAVGRIGDGRFHFVSNSGGSSLRQFAPQNVSLTVERPNGQRFAAGDFSPGAKLSLLTANVRGGFASLPAGRFDFAAFAGRTTSGLQSPIREDTVFSVVRRRKLAFDTNLFGGYVSNASDRHGSLTWAAGAVRFSGAGRTGSFTSGNLSFAGSRLRAQADAAIGKFESTAADSRPTSGIGSALDLAATYQLAQNLSVYGRYSHIGKNFISPQTGTREPLDLRAAGMSWSPTKWLSTSLNASTVKRTGEAGRPDNYVTASFGVTPGAGKPHFYISHTQSSSRLIHAGSFTLVNVSKDFSRWRLFANATRIKALGRSQTNVQFGANHPINDTNSVEASQGIGSGRNLNGTIDWRSTRLLGDRLSFQAGGGYSYSSSGRLSVLERITTSLKLPNRSSLQVSLVNTEAGATVLFQLRGTLFRKRESQTYLNSPISEAKNFGSISGRAYQDVNGNGVYDAATDKPQAGVKVRIDGNRYVETDPNGNYQFTVVPAGDHNVSLDLVSIRADLTLLDINVRQLAITGGGAASLDFRLVRTGRVSGRVWLDANGNGKFDEGETPLADIRVVTASARDTLTNADGFFTITDLVPGEHVVFIDEKTLPEVLLTGSKFITARIFAGTETSDLDFGVKQAPVEIKRFQSKN